MGAVTGLGQDDQARDERHWSERGIWELMNRAEPAMRDELMRAWERVEAAEAQLAEAKAAARAVQRYAEALAVSNDVTIEQVPADLLRIVASLGDLPEGAKPTHVRNGSTDGWPFSVTNAVPAAGLGDPKEGAE